MPRRRRGVIVLSVIGCLIVAAAAIGYRLKYGGNDETLIYYTVKRADLPITVTERGTLESQENVQILCKVDDVRGDNIEGASIVWLIENGSSVTEGELLVELGSASYQEQLDRQVLDTERATAEHIRAKAKYENQITQNATTLANADLEILLAELEMEMYADDERGTHKLEVEEIRRLIEDINNEILSAQASMKLKKNDRNGIETLFKLGYAGKSEVDRYRLEFLQAEGQYAAKLNKLTTQIATLEKKQTYERQMQTLRLDGKLETSRRTRVQVERDNVALLDEAKGAATAAERTLKKETERLERYRKQLANCKIHAPQAGMVVYAASDGRRWWMDEIREGGTVRPRQNILSLPNLKKMQVKTSVHESVLDQIKTGMHATIRVEAFPDRHYDGQVESLAVIAAAQGNDNKVYDTVVTIRGEVEQLKPGMTAVVEIHAARLTDVLSVPVQAIVQREKAIWCYVKGSSGRVERRSVTLGRTNDEFVEIRQGVEENEHVVLNPDGLVRDDQIGGTRIGPNPDSDEPDSDVSYSDQTPPSAKSAPAP